MKVVVTAATTGEWMPALLNIPDLYTCESNRFKVLFHQSGVGMLSSAVSLTSLMINDKPDFVIQIGIAGTFDNNLHLGKIVIVKDEMLGDMGVTEENKWKDIFDLKLEKSSYPPFEKRKLPNPFLEKFNVLKLPEVNAVTVNEITTDDNRIQQIIKKYDPVVESMEGAALHYVCREFNTPFIQMRSISNYIGDRDKANWKIKEAIDNLNQTLLKFVDRLYKIA
jgi:futalosine hydrolase